MKIIDLYSRIIETTGLEVITTDSINAAIANCFADLTSRGYRDFEELDFDSTKLVEYDNNLVTVDIPDYIRKVLYVRVYFETEATNANRVPLANKMVQSLIKDGEFRSDLINMGRRVIFYIKNNKLYIEWLGIKTPIFVRVGIHKKLEVPRLNAQDITAVEDIGDVVINIRKEFEDALVLYSIYFFFARELKDNERMVFHLNQYKYYVEDILHELNDEDIFQEDDVVVIE
jgi:hypothetical protein